MATRLTCRPATMADTDAIATVFSSSFRLLTFLPMLHTVEEDRGFIADVILKQCEVTVAESDGRIASFLALKGRGLPPALHSSRVHRRRRGRPAAGRRRGVGRRAGTVVLPGQYGRAPLLRAAWLPRPPLHRRPRQRREDARRALQLAALERLPARTPGVHRVSLGCGPVRCRWHQHFRPGVHQFTDTPTPLKKTLYPETRQAARRQRAAASRLVVTWCIIMRATLPQGAPNTYYGQWNGASLGKRRGN